MTSIGILLPTRESVMYDPGTGDPRPLVALAERAEQAGFDSVWAGDSLLAKPRAEPLTLLAGVAARTTRVALGTAVLLASQRNPEQLAQATATLDAMSDGRLILGIGAGPGAPNVRADHELVGADFDRRSSRAIEVAQRVRSLWTGADGTQMYPLPGRREGPPVWIGGEGPRTLERTGRLADGWFPISPNVATFSSGLARVRESAEEAGRSADDLAIGMYVTVVIGEPAEAQRQIEEHAQLYYGAPYDTISRVQGSKAGSREQVGEWMQAFIDAGAQHLCVRFGCDNPEAQLDLLAGMLEDLR